MGYSQGYRAPVASMVDGIYHLTRFRDVVRHVFDPFFSPALQLCHSLFKSGPVTYSHRHPNVTAAYVRTSGYWTESSQRVMAPQLAPAPSGENAASNSSPIPATVIPSVVVFLTTGRDFLTAALPSQSFHQTRLTTVYSTWTLETSVRDHSFTLAEKRTRGSRGGSNSKRPRTPRAAPGTR